MFRNVKGFKSSMREQTQRLAVLEERLVSQREKYQTATDASARHDAEYTGRATRRDVDHVKRYVKECEAAINTWADTPDATINRLANFKYWTPKEKL